MPLGLRSFREAQQAAAEERRMRFSVWPGPMQTWGSVLELARHAEDTGWDGLWFAAHFMPNARDPAGATLECWAVMAALAVAVPRVRLGTLVCGNTYRHPPPDFHLGGGPDRIEFYDRFISEVAASLRD